MALKTRTLTIDGGRDGGKRYLITEMNAVKADRWAMRLLFAMANSGVNLGFDPRMGMAAMIGVGFEALSRIKPEDGMPLIDELMDCVQIVPDGGQPRPVEFDGDVEDFLTFWKLRKEVFALHTDFLQHALGTTSEVPSQE